MTDSIEAGNSILINYTLALENGTVVESTEGSDPLRLSLGDGTFIESLEAVVIGMKVGERQCLHLDPREAFGFPDETNVHMLTRDKFPEEMPLEKDLIVGFTTPSGEEVPGRIMEIPDDELVIVDFNHPLAGHTVTFDVEILAIGAEEEIS